MAKGPRQRAVFTAPLDGLSHVSGERAEPLLHKTIPALLADTVTKFGPREAAVFLDQGRRFTWSELAEEVDALAAGLLALGLENGDRIGIWSPNRWEWLVTQFATARIGLILVNINPAYRLYRARICAEQGRLQGAGHGGAFQDLRLSRHARRRWRRRSPPPSRASCRRRACPRCEIVIRMGDGEIAGHAQLRRCAWRWAARGSAAALDAHLGQRSQPDDADQHPVHLRHDRRAQGRDADPRQHRQQRPLRHRGDAASPPTTGCASRCRSITASAW